MTPDWKTKVDFLRANHARKAAWDSDGRLVSIELDDVPPAPEAPVEAPPTTAVDPVAARRRTALGAVGGLRHVRE